MFRHGNSRQRPRPKKDALTTTDFRRLYAGLLILFSLALSRPLFILICDIRKVTFFKFYYYLINIHRILRCSGGSHGCMHRIELSPLTTTHDTRLYHHGFERYSEMSTGTICIRRGMMIPSTRYYRTGTTGTTVLPQQPPEKIKKKRKQKLLHRTCPWTFGERG